MNKTLTCNVSGLVFHIEETGFEKLKRYLDELKRVLKDTESTEEILHDIEARIAELFTAKLNHSKEVITEEEVDQVIAQIGNPSDFISEEGSPDEERLNEKNERVLMRDPENGIAGGVCLGLASYFGFDVVIARIAFIILGLISGVGILLYVLLWLFLPKATTVFDRLKMKGKPISADGIEAEIKQAADRIEKYADKWYQKNRGVWHMFFSNIAAFVASFVGVIIILVALGGLITFFTLALTNISVFNSDEHELLFSLYALSNLVFDNYVQSIMAWMGLFLVVVIPLFFLISLGVSLIRKSKGKTIRSNFLSLLLFWIIGVTLLSVSGFQLSQSFSNTAESEEVVFEGQLETLKIQTPEYKSVYSKNVRIRFYNLNDQHNIRVNGDTAKIIQVPIRVVKTNDSLVRVKLEKRASGSSELAALNRLKNVNFTIHVKEGILELPTFYWFPKEDKLRNQFLRVVIELPEKLKIDWQGNKDRYNTTVIKRN